MSNDTLNFPSSQALELGRDVPYIRHVPREGLEHPSGGLIDMKHNLSINVLNLFLVTIGTLTLCFLLWLYFLSTLAN
jgi:hypothetical protein